MKGAVAIAQKNVDVVVINLACKSISYRQIELAIAVEVGNCNSRGSAAEVDIGWWSKGSVSVSEHNRDAEANDRRQIEVAVTVEITDRYRARMVSGGKTDARSKRPIAIAEQDRHGIGVVIDYCQVELAVAVEITDGDVARIRAYRVGGRRLERSVAISRQHRDCVTDGCAARTIGHHEIELAIAIEIGCGNARGGSACCDHGPSAEGTIAIAQVESDDIAKDAGDRQIEAAVAIEVADHGVCGEAASSA